MPTMTLLQGNKDSFSFLYGNIAEDEDREELIKKERQLGSVLFLNLDSRQFFGG